MSAATSGRSSRSVSFAVCAMRRTIDSNRVNLAAVISTAAGLPVGRRGPELRRLSDSSVSTHSRRLSSKSSVVSAPTCRRGGGEDASRARHCDLVDAKPSDVESRSSFATTAMFVVRTDVDDRRRALIVWQNARAKRCGQTFLHHKDLPIPASSAACKRARCSTCVTSDTMLMTACRDRLDHLSSPSLQSRQASSLSVRSRQQRRRSTELGR